MKLVLTMLAVVLPIFLMAPDLKSEDHIVFCQHGNSFVRARTGACKKGEWRIPLATRGEITRLNERVETLEKNTSTDLESLEKRLLDFELGLTEIARKVAMLQADVDQVITWLCPCNFNAIPFEIWAPSAFPEGNYALDWNTCGIFAKSESQQQGSSGFGALVNNSSLKGPTCSIQSSLNYDAGTPYETNPEDVPITEAQSVACAKSLAAYATNLNAQPDITVANGPPYICSNFP